MLSIASCFCTTLGSFAEAPVTLCLRRSRSAARQVGLLFKKGRRQIASQIGRNDSGVLNSG